MDNFPEPTDAELAEYSQSWEQSNLIDECESKIAELSALKPVATV